MVSFYHLTLKTQVSVCFCYSVDADMEDYGFEYSDEEQEEQDVDIENQYYNSKGICLHLWIGKMSFFGNLVFN